MNERLTCFKAYDLRGRIPDELNEDIAYRVGQAYAQFIQPASVVVGRDIRMSGAALASALIQGLTDAGVDVLDIGLCGTEQVYFATWNLQAGGGIMVTASHNPADYNGMKFVRDSAKPISGDSGLDQIRVLAEEGRVTSNGRAGVVRSVDGVSAYIEHLLGYVVPATLRPLKLVVNAGNGCAGAIVDGLAPHLPFEFVRMQHEPDGTFPNGVPNPLLPENRQTTANAVRRSGADMGIAWDGDFDRCFFFDERGEFVEGYYIVGLLAEAMLVRHPSARIVHDPRLTWNTREIVERMGGIAVQSKTGHAFIKDRMRQEDAVYGGEMSAHHYFRDFAYCDSGMIPWLLVAGILSELGQPLSSLVAERIRRFPCSGEINRRLANPVAAIEQLRARYATGAISVDETDGLGCEFPEWRFNLRLSNTEPVIRLNVETRGDPALMQARTHEILTALDSYATVSAATTNQ
jgi:phosphomannomutase/phosphomannomutase/phosphoglucomutase